MFGETLVSLSNPSNCVRENPQMQQSKSLFTVKIEFTVNLWYIINFSLGNLYK